MRFEIGNIVYGVTIVRHAKPTYCNEQVAIYQNKGFTDLTRMMRWMWYFRLIAAKAQIETPKQFVELRTFNYEAAKPKDITEVLKRRISYRQGNVTKIENKIAEAKKHWIETGKIWPIENEPGYIKMLGKLETAKIELQQLTDQLP